MSINDEDLQNMANEIRASADGASDALDDLARTAADIAGTEVNIDTSRVEKSILGTATKAIGDATSAVGGALKDAGGGVLDYYKAVGEGSEKFTNLNSVMEGAADGFGRLGPVGRMAAGVLNAIGPIGNELLKELDMQRSMYHDLSKYGALTGKGMTNMQDMWLKSQLSSKEFSEAVHRSSAEFALLGGTTSEGLNKYSDVMGDMLQGSDQRLRALGMKESDIARATESYVKTQTSLGNIQKMSSKDIAVGARDYAIQLSTLSKFTGQQIEEVEQGLEKMHESDRAEALMQLLPENEKKIFERRYAELAKAGPEAQKGFADLVAGVVTPASIKLQGTMGSAMADFKKSDQEAINESQQYTKEHARQQALIAAKNIDGYNEMFLPLKEARKWQNNGVDDLTNAQNETQKATNNLDKQTGQVIKTEQNNEAIRNKAHAVLTAGIPIIADITAAATDGLKDLGDEAMSLAEQFSKFTGVTPENVQKYIRKGIESVGFGGGGPSQAFSTEVEDAIKKASESSGVDLGYMRTMAKIESGGRANATNASGAKGLYQFVPGTAREMGIAGQEFDPAANAKAAAEYTKRNIATLKKAGIEPTPEILYMAHQQGAGGVIQLAKAAQAGKGYDELSPELQKNMASNAGRGKSAAEFMDMWKKRYAEAAGNTPGVNTAKKEEEAGPVKVGAYAPPTTPPEVTPEKEQPKEEKKPEQTKAQPEKKETSAPANIPTTPAPVIDTSPRATQRADQMEKDIKEMQAHMNDAYTPASLDEQIAEVYKYNKSLGPSYLESSQSADERALEEMKAHMDDAYTPASQDEQIAAVDKAYKDSLGPNYVEPPPSVDELAIKEMQAHMNDPYTSSSLEEQIEAVAKASGYKDPGMTPQLQAEINAITSNAIPQVFTQDQLNQDLSKTATSTLSTFNEQSKTDLTTPKLADTSVATASTAPSSGPATPNDAGSQPDPNAAIAEMNQLLINMISKLDLINNTGLKQVTATAQLEKAVQTP